MIDVSKILYEICEDENVFNEDFDLLESGILDSYAFIEFFSKLEDLGVEIQITRIDKSLLKTPRALQQLINENME